MVVFEALTLAFQIIQVVSVFKDGLGLFRQWRAERSRNDQKLEQSLTFGASRVQDEYDRDFQRFGDRFGAGDCIMALFHYEANVLKLEQLQS